MTDSPGMSGGKSAPALTRQATRKYKGIALGHPAVMQGSERTWYRIRNGREIAIATVEWLSRDWLEAYCRWHRASGRDAEAVAMERAWLAAPKENSTPTPEITA